ncbi:MAG: carboxypeptidase regulatory-like domain-containing protein [Gemmatimonadaceae bacterium]
MRKPIFFAFVVMHAATASAQHAALAGRVLRAGSNAPIAGAEVVLLPRGTRVVTDAKGEFRFDAPPSGYVMIQVRRIGFAPDSLGVQLPLSAPIDIELRETVQKLDTVSVSARENVLPRGKLAGFHERKQFGIGRFVEEKDIEKMLTRRLGDIIVAKFPGTRTVRSGKGGLAAYVATVRMMPHALVGGSSASGSPPAGGAFSTRTPRPRTCYPDVYLDGVVVYSSGSEDYAGSDTRFDINSIDPAQISAIEFYAGAAQMPAQYNRTGSACGALLIWTK